MTTSTTNKPVETSPTPSVYMSGEWEEETESLVIEPGALEKSTTSSKQTKTEPKPSPSSSSTTKLSDEVSLTEIMQLISGTLGSFAELQGSLAKATEGFSEKQGKALINSAQKTLTKVIDALAAQEAASHKAGLFQKLTMAFTIAVTVAAIFASGGSLASALIPTAMLILTTAKNSDGEGAFNLAVAAIADALPEGDYNKKLVASIIVTIAGTIAGGAGAAYLAPGAALATTVEVSSQVALESGLPEALGDATGKEWVMWLTMSLLTITMVGSGLTAAKQNYETAKAAGKITVAGEFAKVLSSATGKNVAEMEVLVNQMSRAIQMISQVVAGGFQIGTGTALKKAADAGYTANTQSALLTKQQRLLGQSNASSAELQERMIQVISDVYEMMTSLTKSSGKDLETLARQTI